MNLLNVSLQQSIQTLAARGWSARRIARELDINRETVGRWLRLAQPTVTAPVVTATPTAPEPGTPEPKPATVATGSAATGTEPAAAKPATVATGSGSRCEPWREHIEQALAQGLSAMRIYQDLVADHAFTGRYNTVKRFVRRLQAGTHCPSAAWSARPARNCRSISARGHGSRPTGNAAGPMCSGGC